MKLNGPFLEHLKCDYMMMNDHIFGTFFFSILLEKYTPNPFAIVKRGCNEKLQMLMINAFYF